MGNALQENACLLSRVTVCHRKTSTDCPLRSSLQCVSRHQLCERPLFRLSAVTAGGCSGHCLLWTFNWLDLAIVEHCWAACWANSGLSSQNPISNDPSHALSLCVAAACCCRAAPVSCWGGGWLESLLNRKKLKAILSKLILNLRKQLAFMKCFM